MAEVQVKTNFKPFPWQQQVINGLKENRKGCIHVVKSKRQCGKSIMMEWILLQSAINNSHSVSICLSPTLEQARKIFKEIKAIIQPTKLYLKHNDVSLFIVLKNKSMIMLKSSEQREGLRGYTVSNGGVYCIDEAAYIPDDIFFETLAWTNVSQAPIIICSTPNHKAGFFYDYFMLGLENGNSIYSYDWSEFDTSALLPVEKLEEYRKQLPATKFRTEFLGEFLNNQSGVFGEYGHIISDSYDDSSICYFGIDWGTGQEQDETAVCVFNDKRQMIALYHFNDKDETETIDYIVELIQRHKPKRIQVETNSIGSVFYGLLDKAIKAKKIQTQLVKFTTTNESKEKLINNFQVAIQNSTVTILDKQMLKIEMDMYEMTLNEKTHKRSYNAARGYHDDIVIAMLLSFDCINKGVYNIR